jgi:hypothetical protein
MDLLDLLLWFIKGKDWLALVAAGGVGYLAGLVVPAGWWSIFISMLLAYHLFLGWLVLTAKNKMQIVRPLSYAASIHLACFVVIMGIGMGRNFVPHFDVVCCGVAVLGFFERNWLLEPVKAAASDAGDSMLSSAG